MISIYESGPLLTYFIVLAAVFGACMGSFLNCAAWRSVHGESVLKGRSHCTTCGHQLGFVDLIPVLGWVILRGRCRYCGSKIPARYPLTELAFAALTVLCLLRFDLSIECLRNYIFICVLFVLTLTDIDDMIIPDGCHIIAGLAWLATAPFIYTGWGEALTHVAAGLIFGGGLLAVSLVMDKMMGRDTMGGGDIKLFAVVGLYLGIIGTLFAMIIACIAGLLFSAVRRGRSGAEADVADDSADEAAVADSDGGDAADDEVPAKAFPFGPWIAMAAAFMLLYGGSIIDWYLGLLG